VLTVFLIPLFVLADAQSASKQVRVKMSLNVKGTYHHTGPKEIPEGASELPIKLSVDNYYSLEYVVLANTEMPHPQQVNPLDPASQKEMDEHWAKVGAREDRIYHSADHLRRAAMGERDSPDGINPGMMDMGRLKAMQQKVMACGNDQSCAQRVAMEMIAEQQAAAKSTGPGAQVHANLREISEICINEQHQPLGTQGHEECMEAEGRKRLMVPTGSDDEESEVPELPDRYWMYWNLGMDCQIQEPRETQRIVHVRLSQRWRGGWRVPREHRCR